MKSVILFFFLFCQLCWCHANPVDDPNHIDAVIHRTARRLLDRGLLLVKELPAEIPAHGKDERVKERVLELCNHSFDCSWIEKNTRDYTNLLYLKIEARKVKIPVQYV